MHAWDRQTHTRLVNTQYGKDVDQSWFNPLQILFQWSSFKIMEKSYISKKYKCKVLHSFYLNIKELIFSPNSLSNILNYLKLFFGLFYAVNFGFLKYKKEMKSKATKTRN